MATLLLTAVGTAIGGPIGGALGALIGRQVDNGIVGAGSVKGPRLKELTVQTSSYGTALALHFGRVRTAGTVIWSTELIEHEERSGGGKGRPAVTSFTYSASFAVAVSSRPIQGIGRIWADGNLLRGTDGDLKAAGTLRIHNGYGDQSVDPLLAQAEGASTSPGYRGCAYVVFEDLQLADFGNRLPSLTFEVIADADGAPLADLIGEILPGSDCGQISTRFSGFTVDQGTAADTIAAIAQAIPLNCMMDEDRIVVRHPTTIDVPAALPFPAASTDEQADLARTQGWARQRQPLPRVRQCGVRYYDVDRDFQTGLQRGKGRSERGDYKVIDLPAALTATDARTMADAASLRLSRPVETMTYRITEIDPAIVPGAIVELPVADGLWRVEQWEWQMDGVLLHLVSVPASASFTTSVAPVDAGRHNALADQKAGRTFVKAFELPWGGIGSSDTPQIYLAASSDSPGWKGAALFQRPNWNSETILPIGPSRRRRSCIGVTLNAPGPASPLLLDRKTQIDVQLVAMDLTLSDASLPQLLNGANRALVGSEVIQFARALPLGEGRWRLSHLLRGRGGTEWAIATHAPDDQFVLLDGRLTAIDAEMLSDPASTLILAAGLGDTVPAETSIACVGASIRPLAPVHGKAALQSNGALRLQWIRRARGAWIWADHVDAPLNEEQEIWEIALGNFSAPLRKWTIRSEQLVIEPSELTELTAVLPALSFQVRQIGKGAVSALLTIAAHI